MVYVPRTPAGYATSVLPVALNSTPFLATKLVFPVFTVYAIRLVVPSKAEPSSVVSLEGISMRSNFAQFLNACEPIWVNWLFWPKAT